MPEKQWDVTKFTTYSELQKHYDPCDYESLATEQTRIAKNSSKLSQLITVPHGELCAISEEVAWRTPRNGVPVDYTCSNLEFGTDSGNNDTSNDFTNECVKNYLSNINSIESNSSYSKDYTSVPDMVEKLCRTTGLKKLNFEADDENRFATEQKKKTTKGKWEQMKSKSTFLYFAAQTLPKNLEDFKENHVNLKKKFGRLNYDSDTCLTTIHLFDDAKYAQPGSGYHPPERIITPNDFEVVKIVEKVIRNKHCIYLGDSERAPLLLGFEDLRVLNEWADMMQWTHFSRPLTDFLNSPAKTSLANKVSSSSSNNSKNSGVSKNSEISKKSEISRKSKSNTLSPHTPSSSQSASASDIYNVLTPRANSAELVRPSSSISSISVQSSNNSTSPNISNITENSASIDRVAKDLFLQSIESDRDVPQETKLRDPSMENIFAFRQQVLTKVKNSLQYSKKVHSATNNLSLNRSNSSVSTLLHSKVQLNNSNDGANSSNNNALTYSSFSSNINNNSNSHNTSFPESSNNFVINSSSTKTASGHTVFRKSTRQLKPPYLDDSVQNGPENNRNLPRLSSSSNLNINSSKINSSSTKFMRIHAHFTTTFETKLRTSLSGRSAEETDNVEPFFASVCLVNSDTGERLSAIQPINLLSSNRFNKLMKIHPWLDKRKQNRPITNDSEYDISADWIRGTKKVLFTIPRNLLPKAILIVIIDKVLTGTADSYFKTEDGLEGYRKRGIKLYSDIHYPFLSQEETVKNAKTDPKKDQKNSNEATTPWINFRQPICIGGCPLVESSSESNPNSISREFSHINGLKSGFSMSGNNSKSGTKSGTASDTSSAYSGEVNNIQLSGKNVSPQTLLLPTYDINIERMYAFQVSNSMKSDVWLKFLKELKQNSTKMSNYFRKTIHLESPLKLRLTEIDKDEEVADLLTSSFTPVRITTQNERNKSNTGPTIEVNSLIPTNSVNHTYINNLHIKLVNFNKSGYKNVCCRIEVRDSDKRESQPLTCLYPQIITDGGLQPFIYSNIQPRQEKPSFFEEIRVELPVKLHDGHHILFTFFNVDLDKAKKMSKSCKPIGFSFFNLLDQNSQNNLFTSSGLKNMALYEITGNNWNSIDCKMTEENYLKNLDFSTQISSKINERRLDKGALNFQIDVNLTSSVFTTDPILAEFFMIQFKPQGSMIYDSAMKRIVEALAGVGKLKNKIIDVSITDSRDSSFSDPVSPGISKNSLISYFPIIMNQLFHVLTWTEIEDLSLTTFKTIARLINRLKQLDRLDILQNYAKNVFQTKINKGNFTGRESYSHESIMKCLVQSLNVKAKISGADCYDSNIANIVLQNLHWFLELVFKSMVQMIFKSANNSKITREYRFDCIFMDNCRELITNVLVFNQAKQRDSMKYSREACKDVARFLGRALCIMDRTKVFEWIKYFLSEIEGNNPKSSKNKDNNNGNNDHKSFGYSELAHHELKLTIVEILCQHEHFVQLNLPALKDSSCKTDLNIDYMKNHFLSGILFWHLDWSLRVGQLRQRTIQIIHDLVVKHTVDDRFSSEAKCRIFSLYLPFLGIVSKYVSENFEKLKSEDRDKQILEPLLITYLAITNFSGRTTLERFWTGLSKERLGDVMNTMLACVKLFSYKVFDKSANQNCRSSFRDAEFYRNTGKETNKETHRDSKNHRDSGSFSYRDLGESRRFSSEQEEENVHYMPGNSESTFLKQNLSEKVNNSVLLALLQFSRLKSIESKIREFSLFSKVLELLVTILKLRPSEKGYQNVLCFIRYFCSSSMYGKSLIAPVSNNDHITGLLQEILRLFSSQYESVRRYSAMTFFYLLKANFEGTHRQSIRKLKDMSIISFHGLMGQRQIGQRQYQRQTVFFKHNLFLIRAMINEYRNPKVRKNFAKFTDSLTDLVQRLETIITSTADLSKYENNTDMLVDELYRIANSYSTNPDISYTWLVNIRQEQEGLRKFSESAMASVHALKIKLKSYSDMTTHNFKDYNKVFQTALNNVTENAQRDGCIDWAKSKTGPVITSDTKSIATVPPESNSSKHETQVYSEIIKLIHEDKYGCIPLLIEAERYETVINMYECLIPIFQSNNDFESLQLAFKLQLIACQKRELRLAKRIFGTYFRVRFFGSDFPDFPEFIYKERDVTPLAKITETLQLQYSENDKNVQIVRNSQEPVKSEIEKWKLNFDSTVYIQVTNCVPILNEAEIQSSTPYDSDAQTSYTRHHNVKKFLFETPIGTKQDGIRKTVITTTHTFPYLKSRIKTIRPHRKYEREPIQVAIEKIEERCRRLEKSFKLADTGKLVDLQLILSGSVQVTVNAGPLSYAQKYLVESSSLEIPGLAASDVRLLKTAFRRFVSLSNLALEKHGKLVSEDQTHYHNNLENGFQEFVRNLGKIMEEDLNETCCTSSLNDITSDVTSCISQVV